MKGGKKRFFILGTLLLAALFICLPLAGGSGAGTVYAAGSTAETKVILKKKSGKLYGYVNGNLVKNAWKSVKGARYYFNKKGAAVTGSVKISGAWYIFGTDGKLQTPKKTTVIKIGKKYYRAARTGKAAPGWDAKKVYYYGKNGARVVNGWTSDRKYYLGADGKKLTGIRAVQETGTDEFGLEFQVTKLYAFGSSGKKNAALTKKLQAAAVYEKDFSTLKKLIGEPISSEFSRGCYDGPLVGSEQPYAGGTDGKLVYKHFIVNIYKAPTGEEFFMDIRLNVK